MGSVQAFRVLPMGSFCMLQCLGYGEVGLIKVPKPKTTKKTPAPAATPPLPPPPTTTTTTTTRPQILGFKG